MAKIKAKNQVVSGDYKGKDIKYTKKKIEISSFLKSIPLDSSTVQTYELVNEEHKKDVTGLLSTRLLYGRGALIAHSALSNGVGIYNVAIQFKDGKTCLIEIDEDAYQVLNQTCFRTTFSTPGNVTQHPEATDSKQASAVSSSHIAGSVFCTNCGQQVPAGSKFCNACGTPIIKPTTSSATTSNAPVQPSNIVNNPAILVIDGKTFDLEPIYDQSGGKKFKMQMIIDSNFPSRLSVKRSLKEEKRISDTIDNYIRIRKSEK